MDKHIARRFSQAVGWRYIIPPGFFSPSNSTIAVTGINDWVQETISADAIRVFVALGLSPSELGEIFTQQMSTVPDFVCSQDDADSDDDIPLSEEDVFVLPDDSPYAFLKTRYMSMLDWKGWFRLALLSTKITKVVIQPEFGSTADTAFILIDPKSLTYEFGDQYKIKIGSRLLATLKDQVDKVIASLRGEIL
ncbi:MAG: hypothetical protein NUV81_03575 [bacterium]|nr:hypothetical protein [bacterium]